MLKKIEELVHNPPATSIVMDIDPATAEQILMERNEGNRSPKTNKVQQFAMDMEQGRWGVTGDTIKFGTNGRLLDGQNRLKACVKCSKSFRTHVVFGIDPTLFGRMDIGKPRNSADILHIAGYKYATVLAAAIRWSYLLDTDPYNRVTLQPEFVLELAQKNYPDLQPFLKDGRDINQQYGHPVGQITALVYKFSKSDNAKSKEFVQAWRLGKRNGKYQIINYMQAKLHALRANNNGRIHELTRASLIIKAWNIFKANQKGSLDQLERATIMKIEPIS